MDSIDFINDATRTESQNFYSVNPRVLHAALGLSTEANEIIDHLKKVIFYGKQIDAVNLKEEAGDILWYLAILFDELDTSFEDEMERVIKKLKTRYPDKFTNDNALVRDLEAERKVLECH